MMIYAMKSLAPFGLLLWTILLLAAPLAVKSFTFGSPPLPHSSTTALFSSTSSLADKLKSSDRFDRWKFLQELLDDFVEDEDTHQVLYELLDGYPYSAIKDADDGSLPTATREQEEIAANLLEANQPSRAILALTDASTLGQVEQLIPDPQEDEDGFKSTWDTVLELHGRELVKVNEETGTERWKALSTVSRVLIHYEFLTEGIRVTEEA